jgi:indole-3-glycerol phosphate synthase
MVHAVPDILARIVARKREALAESRSQRAELEKRAADRRDHRDFKSALTARQPAIIAEIKQASPSKGTFTGSFDPSSIARTYASGGAAALSVLTDREFFRGCLEDLNAARSAAQIPVLRKDFTIDEFHVIEAAAHGADAILLIAAVLDESAMRRFREMAAGLGMAALVEVHDREEAAAALGSGADIIGVNNRNLQSFQVTLETSLCLADKIPASVVRVSESGIHSSRDVQKLAAAGFNAFLVGEHLMKSENAAAAIGELRSSPINDLRSSPINDLRS